MHNNTKEEQAARFLREGIIAGRWRRGEKLKQEEIARTLGLSITPVREAFKLLEAEGYLQGLARRGVVVAPFDGDAAEELLELRVTLECQLALAALQRLDAARLAGLRTLQREFEAAAGRGDAAPVRTLNHRFHHQLYAAAGRPQTHRFVNILWARYPFDLINRVQGRVRAAAAEHGAIMEALLSGDRAALLVALRTHILKGWQALQTAPRTPALASVGGLRAVPERDAG